MITYCDTWWLRLTPPTSKYHYWTLMLDETLFKTFNNNNAKRKKRHEQIQRRRKLETILAIYSFVLKWKTLKGDKELKLIATYCFACWLHWTPPTLKYHYWTLMLVETLFKSFKNNNTKRKKRDTGTNTKEEENWK